ncbi:hypothetical protein QBC45DRAFT_427894 [Copromyces sp. CBS 386.78]|nr:hypothetical protein QBC45DRAFT_427894 [Copromyces sp. CBS 386.78]
MLRPAFLGILSLTSRTIVAAQALAPWEIAQVDTYSPSGRPGSSTVSYIKTTITDPNSATNTTANCNIEWDGLTKDETPYDTALECTPVEDGSWEFEVLRVDPDEERPSISNFILRFTRLTNDGNLYIGSVTLNSGIDDNLFFVCDARGFCYASLRAESTPVRLTPKEIGFRSSELKVRQTEETPEAESKPPIPWQISRIETHRPSSKSATGNSGVSSISLTITEPGTGLESPDMTADCTTEWNEGAGESPYDKVQACSEVEEGYFMFEVVKGNSTIDGGDPMSSFNLKFTRLGADGKTYLEMAEFAAEKNLAGSCGGNGVCNGVLRRSITRWLSCRSRSRVGKEWETNVMMFCNLSLRNP